MFFVIFINLIIHNSIVIIMKDKNFTRNLISMIEKCTCAYTSVQEIKNILDKNDFKELDFTDSSSIESGKYYVVNNDASIIAFIIPKGGITSFKIITSHCDTPSLLLKSDGVYTKNDTYLMHNIIPYGGLLNYGWLDHSLSLAGRITYKDDNKIKSKIIDIKKTVCTIPSIAIHLNDSANKNLDLNMQDDLQPIFDLNSSKKYINDLIGENNILDYSLYLYNNELPNTFGENGELLLSPRIDNITSVYASLKAFLSSENKQSINVFTSFNAEEIGSQSIDGADSNFLSDTLKKICAALNLDVVNTYANSFIISSDNTHASHPNHQNLNDITGNVKLGDGLAIIREISSTTNDISSSVIKTLCDMNNIKYKVYTIKNDLQGGCTLSSISLSHLSIMSVDVGIAEFAMHSSKELCSVNDVYELYKMMKSFYNSYITFKNNEVIIK